MVGRIIILYFITAYFSFAKAQTLHTTQHTIEPFISGLYTFSKYSQIDTRNSDGKSHLMNGLQGNSGYSNTANYLVGIKYQLHLNKIALGVKYEFGNLKTNIKLVSPTISRNSNYDNLSYCVQRHAIKIGIEFPEIYKNSLHKFSFFTGIDFGLSFTNKFDDGEFLLNGKILHSDTGYILTSKNAGNEPSIKVYSSDYNYRQTTIEVEPYLKGTYHFKRFKLGINIFLRLALIDHANILTEYYPSTIKPISQLNSASSTGMGSTFFLIFPI